MGFAITRIGFLDGLGSDREYVLKQTPMRRTAQEAFAQGYETGEIGNRIRRKMVELRPEIVQESTNERVGWHGETSLDVGEKQNSLAVAWLRLDLPLRQSPGIRSYQSVDDEVLHIFRRDRRLEEIPLNPPRRRRRPSARRLLRFGSSLLGALELLRFALRHGDGGRWSRAGRRRRRRRADLGEEYCTSTGVVAFYIRPSGSLTCGPARSLGIPNSEEERYVAIWTAR